MADPKPVTAPQGSGAEEAWEAPAARRTGLVGAVGVVVVLCLGAAAVLWWRAAGSGPLEVASEAGEPTAGSVTFGRHEPIAEAPIEGRVGVESVWTGTEWLVWGGARADDQEAYVLLADGAAYDPATDRWRLLPRAPLEPRSGVTAVWAHDRLVLWGGAGRDGELLSDGAAYVVGEDRWEPLPPGPLQPRHGAYGFAAGPEVLLFGGVASPPGTRQTVEMLPDGAALDLTTGRWRGLQALPDEANIRPWTVGEDVGERLLVWENDRGWLYSPRQDRWEALPPPADGAAVGAVSRAVPLDGERVLVMGVRRPEALRALGTLLHLDGGWGELVGHGVMPTQIGQVRHAGGEDGTVVLLPDGPHSYTRQQSRPVFWDSHLDRWLPIPGEVVADRAGYAAVWTGEDLLVWGGTRLEGLAPDEIDVRADGYRWRLTDR